MVLLWASAWLQEWWGWLMLVKWKAQLWGKLWVCLWGQSWGMQWALRWT